MKKFIATFTSIGALVATSIWVAPPQPASAVTVTVAAAGDIAKDPDWYGDYPEGENPSSRGDYANQRKVADQIAAFNPTYVIPLGDIQYEHGNGQDFRCPPPTLGKSDSSASDGYGGDDCGSYHSNEGTNNPDLGDHAWGEFASKDHPVAGNHEWENSATPPNPYTNVAGYKDYFGAGSVTNANGDPWYKKVMGDWTWYMLDSTSCVETYDVLNDSTDELCENLSGATDGAQYDWLESQLSGSDPDCVGAAYHHPLFSSYSGADEEAMQDIYKLLDTDGGADLILNGHRHSYERFDEQTFNGTPSTTAPMEIVAGTGGAGLNETTITDPNHPDPAPNSAFESHAHGNLELTLRANDFDYVFDNVETGGLNEDRDPETGVSTVACDND